MSMTIIVAATKNLGIGVNGGLPWKLPGEMKYFARVTTGASPESQENVVVMGRKTWESIPPRFRPLKNRRNLIISRHPESVDILNAARTTAHSSLNEALSSITHSTPSSSCATGKIFLIGGAQLYSQALLAPIPSTTTATAATTPLVDKILLTRVLSPLFDDCDVFLPDFENDKTTTWKHASHQALCDYVGFDVEQGVIEEKGVQYQYELWERE